MAVEEKAVEEKLVEVGSPSLLMARTSPENKVLLAAYSHSHRPMRECCGRDLPYGKFV
jgi:hypothetical protein